MTLLSLNSRRYLDVPITPYKLSLFTSPKSLCIPRPAQTHVSNKGWGKCSQWHKALKRRQQMTLFINKPALWAVQWGWSETMLTHFWILSDKSTIWFYSTKKFEDLYVCQIGINNLWVNITEKKILALSLSFCQERKWLSRWFVQKLQPLGRSLFVKLNIFCNQQRCGNFCP